jgi:predicted RNase H-like nuclease
MKIIGVDLGWKSGASGLCALEWQDQQLVLLSLDCILEPEAIFTWINAWLFAQEPGLIAVDAPTLIPNLTGMRLPDKLTHKYFGRYHAGCYPANLSRPFAQRTVGFGKRLERLGFIHAPTIIPQALGRYQIEVFPHPAMVHLFNLERILKYKKGKLAEKIQGLKQLHTYICQVLPKLQPPLVLPRVLDPGIFFDEPLNTKTLKHKEDQLDSLICAYIGAYWWYWGKAKNWVLGDETTGYIVVPAPRVTEPPTL